MNGQNPGEPSYKFLYFGLLVTGKGEEKHLPKLFRSLMKSGFCTFEVIGFVGQRSAITSEKKISAIGTNKSIPKKDEQIGFRASRYLSEKQHSFVVLVDDLEHDRRERSQQIFDRYRTALDTILPPEQKYRASVHFLVNMLEAYYFADSAAVNEVLGTSLTDDEGDVETIRHPKNKLKKIYDGFDEVRDGGEILKRLDVDRVLFYPDTCASLRTLFAWCCKCLGESPTERYRLLDGKLSEITRSQLDDII